MLEALFFQLLPDRIRSLASLQELSDDEMIDVIGIPSERALQWILAAFTEEARPMVAVPSHAAPEGVLIFAVGAEAERALATLPESVLRTKGGLWAEHADWRAYSANPYDLSETIVTLASLYRAALAPQKRLYVWVEESSRGPTMPSGPGEDR